MSRAFDLSVNYDVIAPTYDRRYEKGTGLRQVAPALISLANWIDAKRILEAGCGTGHWISEMRDAGRWVIGIDQSFGMLQQARDQRSPLRLVCGDACHLPFPDSTFDFIYSMNAFHHFHDQHAFITEASRLLRCGGAFAIVGMDPRECRWYLYEYFKTTYGIDLQRFPAKERLIGWMSDAGFTDIEWHIVQRVVERRSGREVLDDPFLPKNSTSQLILLSDEEYAEGMKLIHAAIAKGDASGQQPFFNLEVAITMLSARRA